MKIGTRVSHAGFEFRVIANETESHYGFCPVGCVILRNDSGDKIAPISELTESWYAPGA